MLRQIHEGGDKLLASIERAFNDQADPENGLEVEGFRKNLHEGVLEMSATLASLDEDLDRGYRETLADLAAITGAVKRLSDLAGNWNDRAVNPELHFKRARRLEDMPRDMGPVPPQRGGGKILIADDDAGNRDLLRRRLVCEGHEVVEARDGLEALDLLKSTRCDLLLLDVLMPVLDGFQTLAKIKQNTRLRELPVSRVRDSLVEHFVIDGSHRIEIGAAVGAATWQQNDTASEVLHRADFAMYEEKTPQGRLSNKPIRSIRSIRCRYRLAICTAERKLGFAATRRVLIPGKHLHLRSPVAASAPLTLAVSYLCSSVCICGHFSVKFPVN